MPVNRRQPVPPQDSRPITRPGSVAYPYPSGQAPMSGGMQLPTHQNSPPGFGGGVQLPNVHPPGSVGYVESPYGNANKHFESEGALPTPTPSPVPGPQSRFGVAAGQQIADVLAGRTPTRASTATGAYQPPRQFSPGTTDRIGTAPMGGGMGLPPTGSQSQSRQYAGAGQGQPDFFGLQGALPDLGPRPSTPEYPGFPSMAGRAGFGSGMGLPPTPPKSPPGFGGGVQLPNAVPGPSSTGSSPGMFNVPSGPIGAPTSIADALKIVSPLNATPPDQQPFNPSFTAPSGQQMVPGPGQMPEKPQPALGPMGPELPPNYGTRLDAIKRLQQEGTIGERIGQPGVNTLPGNAGPLSQPLQSLLDGGKPITSPTGASMAMDQMRQNGRPLTNEEAQFNYKNAPADSKYQPNTTVGGAFGKPIANVDDLVKKDQGIARQGNFREAMLGDLNRRQSSGAQPLGGFANSQAEFDARMAKDNKNGANFGGTLPVRGPDGRVTFADGPMRDFGLSKSGKFETDANGRTTKKGGYSSLEQDAMAKAKATFDARRGGLEQRQKDYQERTAKNMADRKMGVQANAIARKDARRFRMDNLSTGERLAFMNPQASAMRDVGLANAQALGQKTANDFFLGNKRIDETTKVGMDRNDAHREASKNAVVREAAKNGLPNPFEKPEKKELSEADIALLPKDKQMEHLTEIHGPAKANEIMNKMHGTDNFNYVQRPEGRNWTDSVYDFFKGSGRPPQGAMATETQPPPPKSAANAARGKVGLPPTTGTPRRGGARGRA